MSQKEIKEIINDFIEVEKNYYYKMIEFFVEKKFLIENEQDYNESDDNYEPFYINSEFKDEHIKSLYNTFENTMNENLSLLNKLNSLQSKNNQNEEITKLQQQMLKIQVKEYITTKEFEEKYNISISSQRDYRGRKNDPLPFRQIKFRGTITYDVEVVEKWLENQYKYN